MDVALFIFRNNSLEFHNGQMYDEREMGMTQPVACASDVCFSPFRSTGGWPRSPGDR